MTALYKSSYGQSVGTGQIKASHTYLSLAKSLLELFQLRRFLYFEMDFGVVLYTHTPSRKHVLIISRQAVRDKQTSISNSAEFHVKNAR